MSVTVVKAASTVREQLAQRAGAKSEKLVDFWFAGDAVKTAFALPNGYVPYAVYKAGLRVKVGSANAYTVSNVGNVYTVTFAVAPGSGADVTIDARLV